MSRFRHAADMGELDEDSLLTMADPNFSVDRKTDKPTPTGAALFALGVTLKPFGVSILVFNLLGSLRQFVR